MADSRHNFGHEHASDTHPPSPLPTSDFLLADAPMFARVFHNSPVGMVIAAPDGRYLAINDAFARMIGWSVAALLGHSPVELGLMSAADSAALSGSAPRAPVRHLPPAGAGQSDVALQMIGGDGRPRDLVASSQSIELRGRPYVVNLFQDLSDFMRLRAGLNQSEQRFRLFFENAPLALIVSNDAGDKIIDVNPAACDQYGYARHDFLALSAERLAPLLAEGQRLARHQTAAGDPIDVEVTSFTFDLAHRPLRMNALRDVTAQTQATASLRDREQRFRVIAQVSSDGVWDWDLVADTVHYYAPPAPGEPAAGQPEPAPAQPADAWLARIHPLDRARFRAEVKAATAEHRPGWTSELRLEQTDGEWTNVQLRGVILYEDGWPVRAIGATVDLSAQQQVAEAETRAAQAERERLARDLHDSVTQSLYSVTLLAEAARRHAENSHEPMAAEFIGRLGGLTHQALRQMRLLVYELRPAVFDGEGLVGALRHRLDSVEKRAGIVAQVVVRGERSLPPSLQGEMYYIAHEALNNALKHAAATVVAVRLDTLGDNILLEIIDNGVGFDPQAPHHGQGLPTMYEHCARLGGELAILSHAGLGTTVRVTLPLASVPTAPVPTASVPTASVPTAPD